MDTDSPPAPKTRGTEWLDASRLREIFAASGLTQEQVAAACGVRQANVSHWLKGHSGCGLTVLAKLAAVLECRPSELMHEDGRAKLAVLCDA